MRNAPLRGRPARPPARGCAEGRPCFSPPVCHDARGPAADKPPSRARTVARPRARGPHRAVLKIDPGVAVMHSVNLHEGLPWGCSEQHCNPVYRPHTTQPTYQQHRRACWGCPCMVAPVDYPWTCASCLFSTVTAHMHAHTWCAGMHTTRQHQQFKTMCTWALYAPIHLLQARLSWLIL